MVTIIIALLLILLTLLFAVVLAVAVHKASRYLEGLNNEDITKRS